VTGPVAVPGVVKRPGRQTKVPRRENRVRPWTRASQGSVEKAGRCLSDDNDLLSKGRCIPCRRSEQTDLLLAKCTLGRNGPPLALENAGLDVFNAEPEIRPEYRKLPNVFHLPHLGTATSETRTRMAMHALDNLDAVLAGKTPEDLLTVAVPSSN